jgi:hypothetical protein
MQVDITAVARAVTGKPLELTRSLRITDEMSLHRFALGDAHDWLHILADAAGGFEVIRYPGTDDARIVRRGHLSDFPAETESARF